MRATRSSVQTLRISEIKTDPEVNRPVDQHWVDKLVANWNPTSVGVPVVAKQNGHYIVLDGQHRLEAMRSMTPDDIRVEVQVLDGLSTAQMAREFVELNYNKPIPAFEKFAKRVTSGDTDACAIAAIVEREGLLLLNQPSPRAVGAVVALEHVFKYDDGETLGQTLNVLLSAFGDDYTSFHQHLLRGVGLFIRRFPEASTSRLKKVLAGFAGGSNGLLGKGRDLQRIYGGQMSSGVAEAILATYNRGLKNKIG